MELYQSIIRKNRVIKLLFLLLILLLLLGIYAPFIASSYPLVTLYKGALYFPTAKVLLSSLHYTQPIDLFFNTLIFTLPLFVLSAFMTKRGFFFVAVICVHFGLFQYSMSKTPHLPIDTKYEQLLKEGFSIHAPIQYHWQDNAALGDVPSLLRPAGQSLYATLFFGLRTSISFASLTVFFTFLIGTLLGGFFAYLGGIADLIFCRIVEVFESLPTLLVLLWLVALQERSDLLFVSFALALFSWTSIARMTRIEILKQKKLPYALSLKLFQVPTYQVLFKHLLPTTFWILISLFPYALFSVITYESALSFLGLSDPARASLGILIDEARRSYPIDPSVFWPPGILLMVLLVILAYLGDELRGAFDPKLEKDSL